VIVLLGAVLGLVFVLTGFVAVMAWRPPPAREQGEHRSLGDFLPASWSERVLLRVVLGAAAAVGVFVGTGWPVAALLAGLGGASVPSMIGARARRTASVARLEAIAGWTEQIRGVINSSEGIRRAIVATEATAPPAIQPEVSRLVARLTVGRERLPVALGAFAEDLAHPLGDKVVAALLLASTLQGSPVELLGELAADARRTASVRLDVEAARQDTYVTTRLILVLTAAMTVWLLVGQRAYMAPYSTPVGQCVLVVIGAVYALAGQRMARMSEPWQPARLLKGVAEREVRS
jgi:tight adherence protein B